MVRIITDFRVDQITGYLVMQGFLQNVSAIDGIIMAEYMERYEERNKTKINHNDRAKLTQLTSGMLFCKYCFQPIDERYYQRDLTSAFTALLEILSAIVCVSLIYLPLLFFSLPVIATVALYGVLCNPQNQMEHDGEAGDSSRDL